MHLEASEDSGEVVVSGGNVHGQLGLGHNDKVLLPRPMALPSKAVAVAAGDLHSLAGQPFLSPLALLKHIPKGIEVFNPLKPFESPRFECIKSTATI